VAKERLVEGMLPFPVRKIDHPYYTFLGPNVRCYIKAEKAPDKDAGERSGRKG
jgi:hypothetical protein